MCARVTSTYMEFTFTFGPKPEFKFSFKFRNKKLILLQTSLHSLIFHFADVLNCYPTIE